MELKLFNDESKFEEYLRLANHSQYDENVPEEEIIISEEFRNELFSEFIYTKSLTDNFKITFGHCILFALIDCGEIIGAVSIRKDEHKSFAGQIRNVAIRRDHRRKGYGKYMIEECEKIIKQHSNYKFLTLTTGSSHGFYEQIGLDLAGILDFDGVKRYYFYKKIQ